MPHIEIEQEVASFMGTEGAISYSDTASTVTSTLPAFAKKGDLVMIDSAIHEAIQVGADLSRAKIVYFDHNDMQDLERKLEQVRSEDKRLRRDSTKQRRFIVTEALFREYGDLAPLKELVELKEKYGYRLFLDESLSFGTLGATGKGLTEHYQVPVEAVDMLTVSMAYSLASIGGLCIGSMEVVDHQRLSGAGYCFSAAAPPFVSRFAREALVRLQKEPALVEELQKNAQLVVKEIKSKCDGKLKLLSNPASPLVVLAFDGQASTLPHKIQLEILRQVIAGCTARDVLIGSSEDIQGPKMADGLGPKFRLTMRSTFSEAEVCNLVAVLSEVLEEAVGEYTTVTASQEPEHEEPY
uniref:serine C-palmitoyltransferase n=1 Tax=Octactis speculum TaxID=3111310 RepID=A0A7S2D437_9STRA